MIVAAQSKQFTLKDDGVVYFQPDSTNPLPGDPLAHVVKGDSLLQPSVALIEGRDLGAEEPAAVQAAVETWLKAHIYTVLEPLFALLADETLAEPVKEIAIKLYEHTGIVPRGEVEDSISKLDAEMRKALRDKKVRLGPVLIFLPDLNKPAAVKLRALLWSLFNDKPLPAPVPRDGAMSSVVDVTTANPDFYRAIGYPLYGPRVIRIDMLDRVINAIYDSAKEGKFQAQHKMAEWMGCPIADLYAILEAMGHRHIVKTEEEKAAEQAAAVTVVEDVVAEAAPAVEVAPAPAPVSAPAPASLLDIMEAPQVEAAPVAVSEIKAEAPKQEQKKPELDWFFLRRGKAHVAQSERAPRSHHHRHHGNHHHKQDGAAVAGEGGEVVKPQRQPFPKERFESKGKNDKKKFEEGSQDERPKFKKKKHDDKRRDEKAGGATPRVYSADASVSDNPFAVLQNLKLK